MAGECLGRVTFSVLLTLAAGAVLQDSVTRGSNTDAAMMVQASMHLREDVDEPLADPSHTVRKEAIRPKKGGGIHPAKVDNSMVVAKAKQASAAQPRAEGEHNVTVVVHKLSGARPVVRGKFAKPNTKAHMYAVLNSADQADQDVSPVVEPEINTSRGNISVRFEHSNVGACENCSFTWGDQVNFTLFAHIPSGFRRGDKVAFSLSTLLNADSTSPVASLLRSTNFAARIDAACQLCEGSCRHSIEMASGDSLNLTVPSFLRGPLWCNETGMIREEQETYNLGQILTLPAEMGAVWLGANITLAVVGEDGVERAPASSTSIALGQSLPEPEKIPLSKSEKSEVHHKDKNEHHKEPKHEHHQNDKNKHHHQQPASMVEVTRENLDRMRTALQKVRTLQGPLEINKALLYTSATAVALAAAEASEGMSLAALDSDQASAEGGFEKDVGREEGYPEKAMILDVNFLQIENGSSYNFSFAADPGCQIVNPDTGSFHCRLSFGRRVTTAVSLHLSSTIEPGSWVKMTIKEPKLGGFMGNIVKSMFQNMNLDEPLQAPICGEAFTLKFAGQQLDVPERSCGYYAMDLLQPRRDFAVIGIEELHQIKMPGMKARIPDINLMPDMTVATRFETFHANGEKILDMSVTMGLGKAWRED